MSFENLGLGPEILKAIDEAGYTEPTPIQAQSIPKALMGGDILGIAQTGTGKTASFTLPMIEILGSGRAKARMPRSLIIAPTRELASQVADNFDTYGKYHKLTKALLIGGTSFNDQIKVLDKGADVLIATPGRLLDLFERGRILLNDVKILVIDEADRMLDMGFIPDVERIVGLLPKMRQTMFYSATMSPEIKRLVDVFLINPTEVKVDPPAKTATTVVQALAVVNGREKREAITKLLRHEDVKNAFIFCNRKRDVSALYTHLSKKGFDACQLHGDMPQSNRSETLAKFKAGDVSLLVCSDVAARGIDISAVSHVFNYDIPFNAEDYVHRIGRTGRAGMEGHAFSLATEEDGRLVAAIEAMTGQEIPRIDIDGFQTAELDESAAPRGRGGRGAPKGGKGSSGKSTPRRGSGGRGRAPKADTPKADTPKAAEESPAPEAAPQPAPEAKATPAPAPEAVKSEDKPTNTRPPREREPRRGRGGRGRGRHDPDVGEMNHGENPAGFGDHVPAFLGGGKK